MKSPFNLKESFSSISGKFKEKSKPVEKSPLDKMIDEIHAAFDRATDLLNQENEFIKEHKIDEAVAVYPQKKASFDHIDAILKKALDDKDNIQEIIEKTRDCEQKFNKAIETNQKMLEEAIKNQTEVSQILVDAVRDKINEGKGYNHLGKR